MGHIIRFPDTAGGWNAEERRWLNAIETALRTRGLRPAREQGTSGTGDPWAVFYCARKGCLIATIKRERGSYQVFWPSMVSGQTGALHAVPSLAFSDFPAFGVP